MANPEPIVQLARDVLLMLQMQQKYFKTKQGLPECRDAEARIKKQCEAIVNPKQAQPKLFEDK